MSSINESISRVREILDYPLSNSPTLHRIYGALARGIQHRVNELGTSGTSLTLDSEQISVVADTDTYTIASTNFGRAMSVVTYSTDDGHIEREVPFFQRQHLVYDWFAPRNAAAGYWATDSSSVHSAERCSFFKDSGTNTTKVKFLPLPKSAATYSVLFTVGDWISSATLTDTPLLSQYHFMFEIPTALFLLPSAKWGQDEVFNHNKRKELAASLTAELQLYTPSWIDFTADIVNASMGDRIIRY